MDKKEIRKIVKLKKSKLSNREVLVYSHKVCEKFLAQDFYKNAAVIYPYLAYNTEIVTDEIIEQAWRDGKKVAVPKVLDDGLMEFYYIDSFDVISEGYCGIPEPDGGIVAKDEKVLILMPGLAFDREHNRIGYGGGFYDRYLERYADTDFVKVSLAYDFQIFDKLEVEEHDQKIDAVITEDGVL